MSGGAYIVAITALAVTPSPSANIHFVEAAEVQAEVATLGDLADLSGAPAALRERAAALPLVRSAQPGPIVIKARVLAERARALMPSLGPRLSNSADDQSVVITFAGPPLTPPAEPTWISCVQVISPLTAGTIPLGSDLQPHACDREVVPAVFNFDRRLGVVVAARDVMAGETVRAPPPFAVASVRGGQLLRLRAQVGPVEVERTVEAMWPARPSDPLFVRASGEVFAISPSEVTP